MFSRVFNFPQGFWKKLALLSFSIFFISAGIDHFTNKEFYLSIMPPAFPLHLEAVYISGFFEVLLGILLMIPRFQSIAAKGLMALLICVYPANIYLAQTNGVALGISPLIAWGRLPFQFVFIGLAYWHLKE